MVSLLVLENDVSGRLIISGLIIEEIKLKRRVGTRNLCSCLLEEVELSKFSSCIMTGFYGLRLLSPLLGVLKGLRAITSSSCSLCYWILAPIKVFVGARFIAESIGRSLCRTELQRDCKHLVSAQLEDTCKSISLKRLIGDGNSCRQFSF